MKFNNFRIIQFVFRSRTFLLKILFWSTKALNSSSLINIQIDNPSWKISKYRYKHITVLKKHFEPSYIFLRHFQIVMHRFPLTILYPFTTVSTYSKTSITYISLRSRSVKKNSRFLFDSIPAYKYVVAMIDELFCINCSTRNSSQRAVKVTDNTRWLKST